MSINTVSFCQCSRPTFFYIDFDLKPTSEFKIKLISGCYVIQGTQADVKVVTWHFYMALTFEEDLSLVLCCGTGGQVCHGA